MTVLLMLALAGMALATDGPAGTEADQARQILDATGVRGGVVVHVGCGDGKLTAALHAGDAYLVLSQANSGGFAWSVDEKTRKPPAFSGV